MDKYEISKKWKTIIDIIERERTFTPQLPEEENEGDEREARHRVGIDGVSLVSSDAEQKSFEDDSYATLSYLSIIRTLTTDREKFIALALDLGWEKKDIAYMLSLHPSQITRDTQKMRSRLQVFRKSNPPKR